MNEIKCCLKCTLYSSGDGLKPVEGCSNPSCKCHTQTESMRERLIMFYNQTLNYRTVEEWEDFITGELARRKEGMRESLMKRKHGFKHVECANGKCEICDFCQSNLQFDAGIDQALKIIEEGME